MSASFLLISLLVSAVCGLAPPFPLVRDVATSGSASVGLQRNTNFRHNGPAEYARALLKYDATLPDHVAKFAPAAKAGGGIGAVSAFNQTSDREYLSPTLVGSPGQVVMLDFDTGSADLWIFSPNTSGSGLSPSDTRRIYTPEDSSSAARMNGSIWTILYGDGSFASGDVWKDKVQIGGLELDGAVVETATSVSPSLVQDGVMSGLMGLSWNHSSTVVPPAPNLLDVLAPALDQKLFSVDLKYHGVGNYDFGTINNSRFTGNISYQPLVKPSEFWQFFVQSVSLGGTDRWLIHDWLAVADSGTTLMLLPDDIVDLYWASVPGAVNRLEYAGYVFPCNATASLPDFSMGFDAGMVVTVPGRYMNFESVAPGLCYGGIQYALDVPFSILGDVFLKSCFAVFDMANAQFGIANKELD